MKIVPVPVRSDNYAYLILDEATKKATAVDPFDVTKVKAAADKLGVQVVSALTTHHHNDHSGGNAEFSKTFPGVPIYGGSDKIPALTNLVKDKDEFTICDSIRVKCLATPCHTQDSICYHVTSPDHPGGVFTGDTLFLAGCGRFFEGVGAEMDAALTYLGTLPPDTVVYNGHEYTMGSVKFGLSVDPENAALQKLKKMCEEKSELTGLTTIAQEKEWNVFMRLDSDPVLKSTGATSRSAVMDKLREAKNNFRG